MKKKYVQFSMMSLKMKTPAYFYRILTYIQPSLEKM